MPLQNKPTTRSASSFSLNVDGASNKRSRDDLDKISDAEDIESLGELWVKMQRMFAESNDRMETIISDSNSRIEAKIDACKLELAARIDGVEKELATVRHECTMKVNMLTDTVNVIRTEMDITTESIRRIEKSQELVVSGVPYQQGENLDLIFRKIASAVGYEDAQAPLVYLKRLARQPIAVGASPPIVCQFALRNSRFDFYSRYLSQRTLSLRHIGFDNDKRVYINENLTLQARSIRAEALKLKTQGKLQKVFTKDGIVYASHVNAANPEAIHNIGQLSSKLNVPLS